MEEEHAHNLCISYDFTMFDWTAPTVVDKHFYRIQ